MGILVPMSPVSLDVTTAHGYSAINSLVVLLVCTLGDGDTSYIGVNTVCCTLEGVANSSIASVSSLLVRAVLCLSCTLGVVAGFPIATISISLCLFAASVKIFSNLLNASTFSSTMLFGLCVRSASAILFAAAMMTSDGEAVGFVMYLCLKNTMSDILVALVFVTHRFQHW